MGTLSVKSCIRSTPFYKL